MRALYRLLDLLFPPKCVLCGRLLDREETDLCGACRREGPVFSGGGMSIPFVTAWMAVYRYEGLARDSLLRFKFGGPPELCSGLWEAPGGQDPGGAEGGI